MGIRWILAGLVVLSILVTSGATILVQSRGDFDRSKQEAEERFALIAKGTSRRAMQMEREGEQIALALAVNPDISHPLGAQVEHPLVDGMAALLHKGDAIFSAFIGHPNGDYIEVSNLEADGDIRDAWGARPEERWVVTKIFDGAEGRVELREFLNASFELQRLEQKPSRYFASQRPWFTAAKRREVHRTDPYELALVNRPALSFVSRGQGGYVVGAITLLSSLNRSLKQDIYPDSYLSAFFTEAGVPLAHFGGRDLSVLDGSLLDDPRVSGLQSLIEDQSAWEKLLHQDIDGESYYVYFKPAAGFEDSEQLGFVALSASEADVLARAWAGVWEGLKWSLGISALGILAALWSARKLVQPILLLDKQTAKIRRREFAAVTPVRTHVSELATLSHSLVNMAENIQHYQLQQEVLHDSIVRLIADAIDQKSPYTAGHCERVPELGIALAEAACNSDLAAFEGFQFASEQEWREFRLAAWLHDCGKITTPEHIVDKGSKLEAQCNRIHEVRMRFEVMLRDAHIRYLEKRHEDPDAAEALAEQLALERDELVADFVFVAECNVGGEFMDEQRLSRLQAIGQKTWVRYLDNRLGLSPAEELHAVQFPSETPAVETLLADRPEHLVRDGSSATRYQGLGFTMTPGEFKQNLGEIYNLSIQRGTLTEEDRYIINEHIIATIKMLESLPWPDDLSRIPEYAGGHHEKLDGTGYPRSLDAEQLSVPARILAVADVMEALTASDRPYKKAKPLSVALGIMVKMAADRHLDADLVRLLITSGVYRSYASEFLPSAQIDGVDEAALLAKLGSI